MDTITYEEWLAFLEEEVKHQQRAIALERERNAFATEHFGTANVAHDWSEALEKLDGSKFSLGGGLEYTWAKATTEQHTARAEYLEKQANTMFGTAQWHRAAAKAIEDAGVTCLEDLG